MIVFSFFHHVARQPIYWLASYGAFIYLLSSTTVFLPSTLPSHNSMSKNSMRILFLSYFFPPYNAIGAVRTGKLVKLLLQEGHDVRVISATRQGLPQNLDMDISKSLVSYTDWVDVDMFLARALGKRAITKIKSTSAAPNGRVGSLRRLLGMASQLYVSWMHVPDRYIGWYPFARRASMQLIDNGWRPDVIYASATPYTALMVAASIGKKYGIPWVGELRDLWTDNPYARHRALSKWLEQRTLRSAAALVTVSEPLANVLRGKYKCPCGVVMNGFDAEDFPASTGHVDVESGSDRRLRIVYTGQLYAGRRDPTVLFDAINRSPGLKSKVQIDFYGRNLEWVSARAYEYGVEHLVKVHDPVSRREAINIQRQADILLLLTWNDPRERGVLTGKLFEYIGSSRPILVLGHVEGDAANLVRDEGFGIASNDLADIANFIHTLMSDPSVGSSYNNVFRARAGKYERRQQLIKLLDVFNTVSATPQKGGRE
ncbi:glycosyltransferase family 4 protein [Pusillimonas sp. T2]|uniref:glycosyltransferase family 4 protein n=1 Tax=Pusillimonas sp. T2 TaxID=1548123 RepID=UPI0013032ABB|nr:glycosyltransferase family 4 protein [Pusillimonas sp. T2]